MKQLASWGREDCERRHLGGTRPGDPSDLLTCTATSAFLDRRRIMLRSLPFGIAFACSLNCKAFNASRSSKAEVCLMRQKVTTTFSTLNDQ